MSRSVSCVLHLRHSRLVVFGSISGLELVLPAAPLPAWLDWVRPRAALLLPDLARPRSRSGIARGVRV